MFVILAQAHDLTVLDTIRNVFSRADTLAHPDMLVSHLQALSVVWAVIFLVAGLLCMFNGYRFYRTATVVLALAIGVIIGYTLGLKISAPYVVAGALGILLAVSCVPMMKFAVAILGGLSGAWVGANVWTALCYVVKEDSEAVNLAVEHHWVGALIGLVVCGMLAFILFKLSVVLFTCVSGSTIAMLGVLALLLQIKPWEENIRHGLSAHATIVPILVFVPAIIALILQKSPPAPTVEQ